MHVTDNNNQALTVKPGETAVVFPESDPRAAAGPALVSSEDFVLNIETREMISQIVFSESVAKTRLTASGHKATSVAVNGNALQVNAIPGVNNSLVTAKPTKPAQQKRPPISPQTLLVPTGNQHPKGLPGSLFNGGFDSGLSGWTIRGLGTAAVIDNPTDLQNHVLELVSGSPVSIEQEFESLGEPFEIRLRKMFSNLAGSIEIYLDDELVGFFDAEPSEDKLEQVIILVDDPNIYGKPTNIFKIVFDAPTADKQVLIDDLELVTVDEGENPASVPILPGIAFSGSAMVGMFILAQRRRRRRW